MKASLVFVFIAALFACAAANNFDDDYDVTSDVELNTELMGMQSLLETAVQCGTGPRISPSSPQFDLAMALWELPSCSLPPSFNHSKKQFKKFLSSKKIGRVGKDYDSSKAFDCKQLVKEIVGQKERDSDGGMEEEKKQQQGDCPFKNKKKGESCWSAALRYRGFGDGSGKKLQKKSVIAVKAVRCPNDASYNAQSDSCDCSAQQQQDQQQQGCEKQSVPTPQQECSSMSKAAEATGQDVLKKAVNHMHRCWNKLHTAMAQHGVDTVSDGKTNYCVKKSASAEEEDPIKETTKGESIKQRRQEIAAKLEELRGCFEAAKEKIHCENENKVVEKKQEEVVKKEETNNNNNNNNEQKQEEVKKEEVKKEEVKKDENGEQANQQQTEEDQGEEEKMPALPDAPPADSSKNGDKWLMEDDEEEEENDDDTDEENDDDLEENDDVEEEEQQPEEEEEEEQPEEEQQDEEDDE